MQVCSKCKSQRGGAKTVCEVVFQDSFPLLLVTKEKSTYKARRWVYFHCFQVCGKAEVSYGFLKGHFMPSSCWIVMLIIMLSLISWKVTEVLHCQQGKRKFRKWASSLLTSGHSPRTASQGNNHGRPALGPVTQLPCLVFCNKQPCWFMYCLLLF